MDPIVVIGAGAAGIMAARRAAELGSQVILLEKTGRLGTKILISGGGKCNITHDGEIEDVLRAFRRNEARFIRPACYRFTNKQIVTVLTDRGLRVYTRPDGRIFPVDQTAKDVVAILRRYLDEVGVDIRFNYPVDSIEFDGAGITGVFVRGNSIPCRCVVLSAGGSSYPNSGTTGDGFRMAESLGHTIVKVRAALAPIKLRGDRWTPLSGVAFRDCVLRARQNGKIVSNWRGDTLITHHGISGPCTLGISREVAEARERGGVTIEIDLVPELNQDELGNSILDYAKENPNRLLSTYLSELLPERFADEFMIEAGLSASQKFSNLDKSLRNKVVQLLKAFPLGGVKEVVLDKGEVVAGGVSLDEVDSQTMRSKACSGLYLCGEVLDIAGPVGGYNLQAAFATGYLAGETAHEDNRSQP